MEPADHGISAPALREGLAGISEKSFFFGHRSVGQDLLDGLAELRDELGARGPVIVETERASSSGNPAFYHGRVGENGAPLSKLSDFDRILREGMGGTVDAAFLKFCYADFTESTDAEALFAAYRETIDGLKAAFPSVAFLHFTAPIVADEGGLAGFLKGALGRRRRGFAENAVRQRYNELVRDAYVGKEPVFDIAAIEATAASGKSLIKRHEGREYLAMLPAYTSDGGHLNRTGRRLAAGKLIAFLSETVGGP